MLPHVAPVVVSRIKVMARLAVRVSTLPSQADGRQTSLFRVSGRLSYVHRCDLHARSEGLIAKHAAVLPAGKTVAAE